MSSISYQDRFNRLGEPQKSMALKEFYEILEVYGINRHLLPVNFTDSTSTSEDSLILASELEVRTNLPKDFGGSSMLDKIAEVAVWVATGVVHTKRPDN